MAERTESGGPGYRVTKVWCRRVERQLTVEQHRTCPYCSDETEVQSARHERFCDYRPGKDPVSFGFPEDKGHYAR